MTWDATNTDLIKCCFSQFGYHNDDYFHLHMTMFPFLVVCLSLYFDRSIPNQWFCIIFQELVMDILRVLSAPDLEVRKKTLNLALDLVTSRNIEEASIVGFLLTSIK